MIRATTRPLFVSFPWEISSHQALPDCAGGSPRTTTKNRGTLRAPGCKGRDERRPWDAAPLRPPPPLSFQSHIRGSSPWMPTGGGRKEVSSYERRSKNSRPHQQHRRCVGVCLREHGQKGRVLPLRRERRWGGTHTPGVGNRLLCLRAVRGHHRHPQPPDHRRTFRLIGTSIPAGLMEIWIEEDY